MLGLDAEHRAHGLLHVGQLHRLPGPHDRIGERFLGQGSVTGRPKARLVACSF